ncbi:hypothetical protein JNUCC42_21400 [Brevibacterium sp. JNUCC-42]|nr:hypothetical protein JNUCC42_21400 [Brevibacterium sp. JNUCC-42]
MTYDIATLAAIVAALTGVAKGFGFPNKYAPVVAMVFSALGYPGKLIGLIEKYGLAQYDKEETTVDRMLADEIILVLRTQWKVSDAMGMKDQAEYLGDLADRVRIASGQEPQNKS